MADKNHNGMNDQLEKHSLPGMNQTGEGAEQLEEGEQRVAPPMDEKLKKHSLPGMNQAGEGPEAEDPSDRPPVSR